MSHNAWAPISRITKADSNERAMTSFDLRALRYFLAVAEAGSYSEAALQLDVSQPAVSRQLMLLQRAMKTRLFRREGRRYALSEGGSALYRQARRIMDEVDVLEDIVIGADKQPGGRLSVGVPAAVGENVMPAVMASYRAKYPKVAVHLLQSDSTTLANLTVTGKIDVALVYGKPALPELEMRRLADLEMGLVAPTGKLATRLSPLLQGDKSLSLAQAVGLPLILPGQGGELRRLIDRAADGQRVTCNVVMEVDGVNLAKALVAAGLGCMVLAYSGVAAEVARGSLQFLPIVRPHVSWTLSIALRRSKRETPAMKAMLAEISEAIPRAAARPKSK